MATLITDLIPTLNREINPPGAELYTTASAGAKIGYLKDGFWDARLAGMLSTYTIALGEDITPAQTTGAEYYTDIDLTNDNLPEQFQMMIVLFAGFRLTRLKILALAVNFTAEAGPVSYEQQASATTLRAVLKSLEDRMKELRAQYSDDFNASVFVMMDGIAQSEYALLGSLADLQIVL
jgi:hypothetical protein